LIRSFKQSYMQFSPFLTTVGSRTCVFGCILFCLNFYTSAGYYCKIFLITIGWDCFGCQVTATLRAMKKLIGWWEWAHTLNTGLHLPAVDNPSFGLNTQSCKQPNTSWVCLKKQLWILVFIITRRHCCLNKHLHRMGLTTSPVCASCELEEETALHFVCGCPTLATLRTYIFGKPIMNASEFTEISASAILRFAVQSGRLEKNFWHNSLKYVRWLFMTLLMPFLFFFMSFFLFYLFPSHFSFHFSPRGAH
jgi:hypothetical protein